MSSRADLGVTVNIIADVNDFDLLTELTTNHQFSPNFGWDNDYGILVTVKIFPGVTVGGSLSGNNGNAAFTIPASFNTSSRIRIFNEGTIVGGSGQGGPEQRWDGIGVAGGNGGNGLVIDAPAGVVELLRNRQSGIIGGGGGGGGSGRGVLVGPNDIQYGAGGGEGAGATLPISGGQAGQFNSTFGAGSVITPSTAGSPGTITTGGTGGTGGTATEQETHTSGDGGNGGDLGQPGTPGTAGSGSFNLPSYPTTPATAGGTGGTAIVGGSGISKLMTEGIVGGAIT